MKTKTAPVVRNDVYRKFSTIEGAPPIDEELIARLSRRSRRQKKTGCLVWTGARERGGYGQAYYKGRRIAAHRLAYIAHHGPIPDGLLVCHVCDNRPCIAVEHLFLGTHQENTDDARRKGRLRWATSCLDAQTVAEMKRRYADGQTTAQVSKAFGLKYGTAYAVKRGRIWAHIAAATDASPTSSFRDSSIQGRQSFDAAVRYVRSCAGR